MSHIQSHYYKYRRRQRRKHYLLRIILVIFILSLITPITLYHMSDRGQDTESSLPQLLSGHSDSSAQTTEEWNLILVNRWHPIPSDYQVELTELNNQQAVDSRIYPDLQKMFDDARACGIMPAITSSYRTTEKQQELMDEKISDYQAEGYSSKEAKKLAEEWVAIPGTSEHEIGLAIDISTADSSAQDASVVWEWLLENSYKYGFIRRYPEDKTDITGVIHEPWHFRYVGKEAAEEIYEQNICLEEYLNQIDGT